MPTVLVRDETTGGKRVGELTVEVLTERVSVRELIRARVYQEVEDFNRRQRAEAGAAKELGAGGAMFRGLVQPTETEATLNGYRLRKPRQIEWREQFEKACAAFEGNQILVLVDERQVADLDEEVVLGATSTMAFLRLVPLVGG